MPFRAAVRLRPLLVPAEHGGWGFLLEPVVIALFAVPGAATALLSLAALGLFLSRQPLKIAIADTRHRRRVARTGVAWMIAAGYLLMAGGGLAGAAIVAEHAFWPAALPAVPLGLVQLWFDSRGVSRHFVPELAGVTALGAVAAAAGLAAGLPWPLALGLWASALVRVLPALVTVRERVQRLHGQPPDHGGAAIAHLLGLGAAGALAAADLMPWGVPIVALLLAVRAAWDLRTAAPAPSAMRIGVRELVTGLIAAGLIGGAWRAM